MRQSFSNSSGILLVYKAINTIQQNRDYLSEIDGLIGDGDHGINMNKGFTLCAQKLQGKEESMSSALKILGRTLFAEIGGSMGPLYGQFFMEMSKAASDKDMIDSQTFLEMLERGTEKVKSIGGAKVGDKTLVDVLDPALEAFRTATMSGESFTIALKAMCIAADNGRDSTVDMVAKLGRSSRLGERSRGVLDTGATSCSLIINAFADGISELLADTKS